MVLAHTFTGFCSLWIQNEFFIWDTFKREAIHTPKNLQDNPSSLYQINMPPAHPRRSVEIHLYLGWTPKPINGHIFLRIELFCHLPRSPPAFSGVFTLTTGMFYLMANKKWNDLDPIKYNPINITENAHFLLVWNSQGLSSQSCRSFHASKYDELQR